MNRRAIGLGISIPLFAQAPPAVEVGGAVKQGLSLIAADLASMPRASVQSKSDGVEVTYEGVWLHEVLKRAGIPELRRKGLATCLLVEAKGVPGGLLARRARPGVHG